MHINDKQTNRVYSWTNDQNPSFGCPFCDEAGTKNSESPWRNRAPGSRILRYDALLQATNELEKSQWLFRPFVASYLTRILPDVGKNEAYYI